MDEEKDDQNKKQDDSTGDEKRGKTAEEKLEESQKQAEECLNNWKRERADFVNYKKDEAKRMTEFVKFASESLILEIIEVLDDLELAQKNVKNEGLGEIIKKFKDILKKYGVEEIEVERKQFDPNLHEQVFADSGEFIPSGAHLADNMQKIRSGYTMNGKVIRAARVRVIPSKLN